MEIQKPLAEQLRPKNFDEFIGQEHIVGKEGVLRQMVEKGEITSIIFWGPPGCGKTTLARLIPQYIKAQFISFSAVTGSVKDIREIIRQAKDREKFAKQQDLFEKDVSEIYTKTILFVDEIHRFNKAQQDAFLPHVEDGTIILIGATTENPGFEVNAPLVSRSQIYLFKKLTDTNIREIINRAKKIINLRISEQGIEFLIHFSNGDARKAINSMELLQKAISGKGEISVEIIEKVLQQKSLGYDKKGDGHYDTISAFIKSMRGSKPDATLHYLSRMIKAGEDPIFIARRMVIFASEDIGNIRPNALVLATSTMQACKMIGMPEAQIILAQCATYLATCPKSIASYVGINEALRDLDRNTIDEIPLHLRNSANKVMEDLGYGDGHIRYTWMDKSEESQDQEYMPENLIGKKYYRFTENSQDLDS